jgi:glutamate dehydrogenase/leucine dehydrogenase
VSAAAEVSADEPDVDAAAAAAIAAITDRFDRGAIDDLDISISAVEGMLTVDVYLTVPAATQAEIDGAAAAAVDAAIDVIDEAE